MDIYHFRKQVFLVRQDIIYFIKQARISILIEDEHIQPAVTRINVNNFSVRL